MLTGEIREMELNITEAQIAAYNNGLLIQHAFPHLNADEREFFKTGIVAQELEDNLSDDEGEPEGPTEEDKAGLINPRIVQNHDSEGRDVWVIVGDNNFEYDYYYDEVDAISDLDAILKERV